MSSYEDDEFSLDTSLAPCCTIVLLIVLSLKQFQNLPQCFIKNIIAKNEFDLQNILIYELENSSSSYDDRELDLDETLETPRHHSEVRKLSKQINDPNEQLIKAQDKINALVKEVKTKSDSRTKSPAQA